MNKRTWLLVILMLSVPLPSGAVTISTVPIGNAGNPPDTRYNTTGFGAVGYEFRIGKTEVTNAQYVEFLNAVAKVDTFGLFNALTVDFRYGIVRTAVAGGYLYSTKAPVLSGGYSYDNKPVAFVSWGDAARFANWMHNGQPTGGQTAQTTEAGAYTLNGATSSAALAAVKRNPNARWWIPSENEWYKAAYHKNDGVTGNYWNYPTGSDVRPSSSMPSSDSGNSANFGYANGQEYPFTDAGAYSLSGSPYSTFDQGGNVEEWNETMVSALSGNFRGGNWLSSGELHASSRHFADVRFYRTAEYIGTGFRLATTIPEPTTLALTVLAIVALSSQRKR